MMTSSRDDLPGSWASLGRSLRFAYRAEPAYLFLAFGVTVARLLPEVAIIVVVKSVADGIQHHDADLVVSASAWGIALGVLIWLFSVISGRINQRFADRVTVLLESHVARLQACAPSLAHQENPAHLDRLAVLRNQVFALNHLYGSLFATVACLVRVVITLILLASVSPLLLLLGLVAVPGIAVSGWRGQLQRDAQEAAAQHMRRARHYLMLTTDPAPGREIRVAGLAEAVAGRHVEARRRWYRPVAAMRWRGAAWQASTWLLFGSTYVAAVWFVVERLHAGAGDVVVVLVAGSRVAQYVAELVVEANFLRGDWIGASRRLAWLEDYAAEQAKRAGDQPPPEHLEESIRFEGVSFTYPGTTREVLTDIELELRPGSVVALVGENGAGKSTLVKLLCRFYEPSSGRITVDGLDLSRFDPENWRAQVTGTFQDFCRFEFIASRTIGVGSLPDRDDLALVRSAAVRAGADGVLDGLPEGADTRLGSSRRGGVDLSFGQWQKLAIARGYMRPSPLLRVLDEPTSALDAESEAELFLQYEREVRRTDGDSRGGVTLLVSHRMATVRMADLIVVLDGSSIVEQGSHDELMARGGRYADLFSLQARTYR